MSEIIRTFWLPLAVFSLLLLGCGVEIAPEAITATAVAEEEAAGRTLPSTFGNVASDDSARSLGAGSSTLSNVTLPTAEPINTLPAPAGTPTPEPASETAEPEDAHEAGETSDEASEADAENETPTSTPAPEPTATPAPVVTNENANFAAEFLGLLNAQRTGRGMGPLTLNVVLTAGATQFAGYMGTAGFFGHDGPDGSTAGTRTQASGYTGAWNGEALSAGQPTPQLALNALLASPPHAAILLDPRSQEVGVGYAFVVGSRYLHYWVILTGIP